MSLLSRLPISTASEARIRHAELEIDCYSNIGTRDIITHERDNPVA